MSTPTQPEEQDIPITLPERYWVIILSLLEEFIQKKGMTKLQEVIAKGTKPEELTQPQITAMVGPLFARGAIVKELVARGVMKKEADDQVGIDKLMALVEQWKKQDRRG